jgi:hypothetical protein
MHTGWSAIFRQKFASHQQNLFWNHRSVTKTKRRTFKRHQYKQTLSMSGRKSRVNGFPANRCDDERSRFNREITMKWKPIRMNWIIFLASVKSQISRTSNRNQLIDSALLNLKWNKSLSNQLNRLWNEPPEDFPAEEVQAAISVVVHPDFHESNV